MTIPRALAPALRQKLSESKIVVLRGPRRSGRKTLLREVLNEQMDDAFHIDCNDKKQRRLYDNMEAFAEIARQNRLIILEEAQLLTNLQGMIDLALAKDTLENLVLCCSFEPALQEELWEALRLEGLELELFPLSYPEMVQVNGLGTEEKEVERRLIFGYYPEIVTHPGKAEALLQQVLEESIFSQLGAGDRINKVEQLSQLLRLLAFRIGQAISYNELGLECGLDNETVERYIKLLEKAHLLFILPSFHNGNRYELKKSNTVYFVDNGIRNALIKQLQPLEFRNDKDVLWKNWVISERRKANRLAGRDPQTYFWKTHTKQEMDYVELNGNTNAFRMQWDKRKAVKIPASFSEAYPEINTSGVNRSTFWTFIAKK